MHLLRAFSKALPLPCGPHFGVQRCRSFAFVSAVSQRASGSSQQDFYGSNHSYKAAELLDVNVLGPDGNQHFGGHSLRIGGAYWLAAQGVELLKIELL
eukprot:2302283-Amphidinium_carterae.1